MEYLGKYRAIVEDIDDPQAQGRIRVKCPKALGDSVSSWALPNLPPNYFTLPNKGDLVWVEFEGGERDSPVWTGVFYNPRQFADKWGDVYKQGTQSATFLKARGLVISVAKLDKLKQALSITNEGDTIIDTKGNSLIKTDGNLNTKTAGKVDID